MSYLNENQIRENIRGLNADIEEMSGRLDGIDPDGLEAEGLERMLNTTDCLLAEQLEMLDRLLSEAPRRAAEARLAYHVENDTLDLY